MTYPARALASGDGLGGVVPALAVVPSSPAVQAGHERVRVQLGEREVEEEMPAHGDISCVG